METIPHKVGGLPLIHAIAKRMKLKEILYDYIPTHGNEEIHAVDTLILLIYSMTLNKMPLYGVGAWARSIDPRCIGYEHIDMKKFNDDRFGRSLDKVSETNKASLEIDLVLQSIKAFAVNLDRIHNDSTSVKAYGKYPGKTHSGFELKRGHSKDHRPDLKQLIYSLSITSDGGIPVHCKVYPGNRTDDSTHIETWTFLCKITGSPKFIYVADCKVCTDKQLHHIVSNGGTVITIIPNTWKEVKQFKEQLRKTKKQKKEIWKRPKRNDKSKTERFSVIAGEYYTERRGYRIHWIFTSEKCAQDRQRREALLKKVEHKLMTLNSKLNTRNLKTEENILQAVNSILEEYEVSKFFNIDLVETTEEHKVQVGKGRPGNNTKYVTRTTITYTLTWGRIKTALQEEAQIDGIFPLLCTNPDLPAKKVLQDYKYQPNLEKRFMQLKSVHNVFPLLFKSEERVESQMYLFFFVLMIQALMERELRAAMKERGIESIIELSRFAATGSS